MVHDKRLCSAQAVATCFAAFHVVIGQDFHVVPPSLAVEVRSLLSNAGQGQHEDCCEAREYFAHHGFPSFCSQSNELSFRTLSLPKGRNLLSSAVEKQQIPRVTNRRSE